MAEQHDDVDYVRAAGPVAASVIHTGAEGLVVRETAIDRGDVRMPIYAARPGNGSRWPVVLVLSEAFGLHAHIRDVARRLAHAGYLAVAPDLMRRQGDPADFADVDALVRDLLLKIPDAQVMADLDACAGWALGEGGDPGRLNAVGFCWGGRWTWLYAAHRALHAAVAWYGILDGAGSGVFPRDADRFPTHPLDLAAELKAPVLGLYGGRDEAIPVATVEAMRARLSQGGPDARRSELLVYPEAGHAFFADYRGSYAESAARDGWRRCLGWLETPDAGASRTA